MFKFYPQHNQMDCGPACLQMVAKHYGKEYALSYLREKSYVSKNGVSLLGIIDAASSVNFQTLSAQLTFDDLIKNLHLPCILHWNQNHFVVLYGIKGNHSNYRLKIADPGHGLITLKEHDFLKSWVNKEGKGVVLFMNPPQTFPDVIDIKAHNNRFTLLYRYIYPFKKDLIKLFFILITGSIITLILPFLTQILIDYGVGARSLHISFLILLSQLVLFLGSLFSDVIRNQVIMVMGTKVSITIMSDFLNKLMSIPLSFFETKLMGDFNQRIVDQERIESFLTSQGLLTFFSLINFLVFFLVLGFYNLNILIIYLILTSVSIVWMMYFFNKRKRLDYVKFQYKAESQESTFEILNGIHEIKLNDFEKSKTSQWEAIQINLFTINQKTLELDQYQIVGYNVINQLKNILVTYMVVDAVINNVLTIGAMLSISYIIGQMNGPLTQLVGFFRSFQDASISLDRLNEIHSEPNEENIGQLTLTNNLNTSDGVNIIDMSFQYTGPRSPFVLKNININIPNGKITAIVGSSGSGKTTLIKLLLKFYNDFSGEIQIEGLDLSSLSAKEWRKECGVVLQDGYIFSDTICNNIVTGSDSFEPHRLEQAIQTANLGEYISSLPLGIHTKIGSGGNGLSGGQKQRVLIARAVYKNPKYLFFDEATSALDAENEKVIVDNLSNFLVGRTAVIVAHRLSTVKNADQIVVLHQGKIVEIGTHDLLVKNRGDYYRLIKNQLELGN